MRDHTGGQAPGLKRDRHSRGGACFCKNRVHPFLRRLAPRSDAIGPCCAFAGANPMSQRRFWRQAKLTCLRLNGVGAPIRTRTPRPSTPGNRRVEEFSAVPALHLSRPRSGFAFMSQRRYPRGGKVSRSVSGKFDHFVDLGAFGDQVVVSKTRRPPRRTPDGTQCSGGSESGTGPIEMFGAEAERTWSKSACDFVAVGDGLLRDARCTRSVRGALVGSACASVVRGVRRTGTATARARPQRSRCR